MIIKLTRSEGQSIDGKHIRVLARVQAVDAIHVATKDEYSGAAIADTIIKRTGLPFERRKVVNVAMRSEVERLCCLFDIVSTHHLHNTKTRTSLWLSIEKETPILLS